MYGRHIADDVVATNGRNNGKRGHYGYYYTDYAAAESSTLINTAEMRYCRLPNERHSLQNRPTNSRDVLEPLNGFQILILTTL